MADSVRQDILDYFVGKLQAVEYSTGVKLFSIVKEVSKASILDDDPDPSAYVYIASEAPNAEGGGVIGKESWVSSVIVDCYIKNYDTEEALKLINTAIYTDRTCGGVSSFLYRIGVIQNIIDPTNELRNLEITYQVGYMTAIGGC
jgi:hypothetical protein